MDQPHPSVIQFKASKFLQKVSHLRSKLKLSPRNLRDDNDLHPYSQCHTRAKSEVVNGGATADSTVQDDEAGASSLFKPYMSQPLLNLNGMAVEPFVPGVDVIQHIDDQRRTKTVGLPCEAEEAEATLPHASKSYDTHLSTSQQPSERPKAPIRTFGAVHSTPSTAVDSGEGGSLDQTQDRKRYSAGQDANITVKSSTNLRDNSVEMTATAKRKDISEDDLPLSVLKEHVGMHHPPTSDNSKLNTTSPKPRIYQNKVPGIVISYSEGSKGEGPATGARPPTSSYYDTTIRRQERNLPPLPVNDAVDATADLASPRPGFVQSPNRPNSVPLSPLIISPRLSRRISIDPSGNTLRFSPSIVTRHPQLPLKLPALPPVSPIRETTSSQDMSNRKRESRLGLRSMPALPHSGPGQGATGHEVEDEGGEDEGGEDDIEEDTEEGEDSVSLGDDQSLTSPGAGHPGSESSTISQFETASLTTVWGEVTHHFPEQHAREHQLLELPKVDTSRLDLSFDAALTPISNSKGKGKAREDLVDNYPTPTDHIRGGYFSTSNGVAGGPSATLALNKRLTMPHSRMPPLAQRRISSSALQRTGFTALKTLPLPPLAGTRRSGMYKHVSQSMVNIHLLKPIGDTPSRHEDIHKDGHSIVESGKEAALGDGGTGPSGAAVVEEVPPSPKILRRRRSLPSYYGPSSPPPPYPTFSPFPHRLVVQPREDEGKEKLPPYWNDVYLKAIMPRKMEFSKPGMQAKDRKWRRVICVLEGTMFRVYRCSSRVAGVSIIEGWWEKQVGVGDASSSTSYVTATSIVGQDRQATAPTGDGNKHGEQSRPSAIIRPREPSVPPSVPPPEPKRSGLVPFLKGRKNHVRSRSETLSGMVNNNTSSRSPRPSLNLPRTPLRGDSLSSRAPSPGSSMLGTNSANSASSTTITSPERSTPPLPMSGEEVPEPNPSDLIKKYTLQNAECGLGLDYNKRKNVIRVKLEGEQFLLQPKDAMEVIAWIEGIQAGTNVALDLDERPMPRGPLFPRRRRRRRV